MDAFERHMQQVPLSSIGRMVQRVSDGCPAALAFYSLCSSYVNALGDDASLTDMNIAYVLLLHEFWERYEATEPMHQSCLIAEFAHWYKTIRKRELTRMTAMSLLSRNQSAKGAEYPELAGFEEEESS